MKLSKFFNRIYKLLKNAYYVIFVQKNFSLSPSAIKYYFACVFEVLTDKKSAQMLYDEWITKHEPTQDELIEQQSHIFEYAPLISIVTPTYNTKPEFLSALARSLQAQTYPNWELCLADGGSQQETIDHIVSLADDDTRIKYTLIGENKGISGNTIEAINIAGGEYIGLADHDDLIAPNALFEIVKAINDHGADFIYSDEDLFINNIRTNPIFKPDWSPEYLETNNYICHFTVFARKLYDQTEGYDNKYNGAQDFDIILKLTEKAQHVHHIPMVLYHWRGHEQSTAANPNCKSYAWDAGLLALKDHFTRINLTASCELDSTNMFRYRYTLHPTSTPSINVIIHSGKDNSASEKCIQNLKNTIAYPSIEYTYVPVAKTDADYFNEIVQNSTADYILFCNANIIKVDENCINSMLGLIQRDGVGVVSAKIIGSNNSIYHIGYIVGKNGLKSNYLRGTIKQDGGYLNRANTTLNVSACSLDFAIISRQDLLNIGGFDKNTCANQLDLDISLSILSIGKRIVINSNAVAKITCKAKPTRYPIAHQDISEEYIYKKWQKYFDTYDHYYGKNFSYTSKDFKINEN